MSYFSRDSEERVVTGLAMAFLPPHGASRLHKPDLAFSRMRLQGPQLLHVKGLSSVRRVLGPALCSGQ